MKFAEINAAVTDLRNSLRAFVGDNALGDVTVRPPAGDADEASFLRLVSWSYALLFEAGRLTIPFLLELPIKGPGSQNPKAARQLVHALRTWSSHNLGFDSERNVALFQNVQRWFIQTCGTNPPSGDDCWRNCCEKLCDAVRDVIDHCQGAVTFVLSAPDDGQAVIADLRRRIERLWPAHEFDKIVSDVATRLGMSIDARKFREARLGKWRSFLDSIAESDDPEVHLSRMIERDLLDHAALVLPIDGRDVMHTLGLSPGPDVAQILRRARVLFRSGVTAREDLLKALIEDQPTGKMSQSNHPQ
jgi:hypothetical protein